MEPLEPTDVIKITNKPKETTVACSDSARKHTGEYILTVSNKHGSDSAVVNVVVLGTFEFFFIDISASGYLLTNTALLVTKHLIHLLV